MLPVSNKWDPFFDQKIKVSQKSVGIGRHLENPFWSLSGTLGSINLGGTGMTAEAAYSALPGLLAQWANTAKNFPFLILRRSCLSPRGQTSIKIKPRGDLETLFRKNLGEKV